MIVMSGPYRLELDEIKDVIAPGWPGVYALGYLDRDHRFCVSYVGSSYDDLSRELVGRIGTANMFKFARCADAQNTFETVCDMFHRFRPVGNFLHPERPRGEPWTCPMCRPQSVQTPIRII